MHRILSGGGFQPFSVASLQLALVIGILPNIMFLVVMPFFIASRLASPLLYAMAGLLALLLPRWATFPLLFAAAVSDLMLIVVGAFHLKLTSAIKSISYLSTLNPTASFFYLAFAAALLATAGLIGGLLLRYRSQFRAASPTPAAIIACLFALLDLTANFPYVRASAEGLGFQSAVNQAGLSADIVARRGHNLFIVVIEGMGAFAAENDREIVAGSLKTIAARYPYEFQHGTSFYNGSTTDAESRELCGKRGDFRTYLPDGHYPCLPRQLSQLGYRTISYHGFSSAMFERQRWYPNIGFKEMNFEEELLAQHATLLPSRCGSVFPGLCDSEMAEVIRRELIAPSNTPKMVYWLTLNSHIPYVPKANGSLDCTGDRPKIDEKTVCELAEYWKEVMDAVAGIASDPALPPTDILIVGDHHTPLWNRRAKNKFVLNKVDWFLLRSTERRHKAVSSTPS
ncbi:hypothetical protein BSL82_03940 [Tardibacter chloracetimidivorans]|uniref:Sulfatase N-terminal domain-containing protein n=2 Tax=Tardibacter chloracetimidivorans TaxID=1921510 RepID=A0A1L3ZSG6_9SPHN|nr:hypothetical protein BSL82_03940 [Tardibacter chloracetimidivorans]